MNGVEGHLRRLVAAALAAAVLGGCTAPIPDTAASRTPASRAAVASGSQAVASSTRAPAVLPSKPCAVQMPAGWRRAILTGHLSIPAGDNRPISAGPDGSVLISHGGLNAAGATTHADLVLVDAAGSAMVVWTSPDPNRYLALADRAAAIDNRWVVFEVEDATAPGTTPTSVMAFNRATGAATRIASVRTRSEKPNATPIVVADSAYWQGGSPTAELVRGEDLDTGTITYSRPVAGLVALLDLDNKILWESSAHNRFALSALDRNPVPAKVTAAISGHEVTSDGATLRWLVDEPDNALRVRSWSARSSAVTSQRFGSSRGLSVLLTYPYLQVTPWDLNPGESSSLQDLRSGVTVELSDALVLSSIAGGRAVFTRSTRQFGPITVYRTALRELPALTC